MNDRENLIHIAEYATLHGVKEITIKQRIRRFLTAKLIANEWHIDKDEPYIDNRIKSGRYRSWRD